MWGFTSRLGFVLISSLIIFIYHHLMGSSDGPPEPAWGRVLIAGGVEWRTNGVKARTNDNEDDPRNLFTPRILRSLCHIKMVKVLTGCSANYAVAIDLYGHAHLFGKVPAHGLGDGHVISHDDPLCISPQQYRLGPGVKWVDGAVGRSHFFLIDSEGGVWGAGNNVVAQLGLPVCGEIPTLTKISGPWLVNGEKVVQATAGWTFSLFLTEVGKVYACGSCEHGQLGNGTAGERLVKTTKANKPSWELQVAPRLIVEGIGEKKIVQIASGNQHSLARDEDNQVYAWGYAEYKRLGLDTTDYQLVPIHVPMLLGATRVGCGPTSSVVVNVAGRLLVAGKWKITAQGSALQPLETLNDHQVAAISLGGCTHFITTIVAGKTLTMGWGQGALYGELGIGADRMSSTDPVLIQALKDIDVIDVSAGAFFTLFLAKPNGRLSEMDRHPKEVESATLCLVCNEENEQMDPLECERCDEPYHAYCLDPPLDAPYPDEWFCPVCEKEIADQVEELSRMREPSEGKAEQVAANGSRHASVPARTPAENEPDSPQRRGSPDSPLGSGRPETRKRRSTATSVRPETKGSGSDSSVVPIDLRTWREAEAVNANRKP